jgi:hypothetical protein
MKKSFLNLIVISFFIGGCTQSSDDATVVKTEAPSCNYSYDANASKLDWTAYKTSEKVAVKGTFNTLNVNKTNRNENMEKVLLGATFEIPSLSVNSQNPERDKKIAEQFFGAMTNTQTISGKITSLNNGIAQINIVLNETTQNIQGKYTFGNEGRFALDATIDLKNFKAENAVKSLNDACGKLHAGADGISKLWDEVTLHFETQLKKSCK